jgi:hypothetical protein
MLVGIYGRHGGTVGAIDALTFMFAKDKILEKSIENMVLTPSIDEINLKAANV